MDKQADGLAGAMREIAGQRDNQLRDAAEIPPARLEQLQAFLAAELPVETGLFAAARQRDESLSASEPVLPRLVHAALAERVRSVATAPKPLDALRQLGAYRAAAALAVAAVIGAALLHFSRTHNSSARILRETRSDFVAPSQPGLFSGVGLFDRSVDPLTLRMNRLELASLDPSVLTINRALFDFDPSNPGLPLDLPIRQIHLDVETVRTP
jgi:hypothetical protein